MTIMSLSALMGSVSVMTWNVMDMKIAKTNLMKKTVVTKFVL